MTTFVYEGSDPQGRRHTGEVDAPGLTEAAHRLASDGIETVVLRAKEAPEPERPGGEADAFSFFNRSLGAALKAGLPMADAVRSVAAEMNRGSFKTGPAAVEGALREGVPLDQALERAGRAFPPDYRALVRAGLSGGALHAVLAALAGYSAAVRSLRKAVALALTYPLFVLAFGLAMTVVITWMSLPSFRALYAAFRLEAPASLTGTGLLGQSLGAPLAAMGGLVALLLIAIGIARKTAFGERLAWRIPILGRVLRQLSVMRFVGTAELLVTARAPMVRALPAAVEASGSRQWRRDIAAIEARLAEGGDLEGALRALVRFPSGVARHILLGERAGGLAETLRGETDRAHDAVILGARELAGALEPVAILAVGICLGAFFISFLSPYFLWLSQMHG